MYSSGFNVWSKEEEKKWCLSKDGRVSWDIEHVGINWNIQGWKVDKLKEPWLR